MSGPIKCPVCECDVDIKTQDDLLREEWRCVLCDRRMLRFMTHLEVNDEKYRGLLRHYMLNSWNNVTPAEVVQQNLSCIEGG